MGRILNTARGKSGTSLTTGYVCLWCKALAPDKLVSDQSSKAYKRRRRLNQSRWSYLWLSNFFKLLPACLAASAVDASDKGKKGECRQ